MVNEEIKKGTDEDEITELTMPEKYENWWFRGFYPVSLQILYKKAIEKSKIK